MNRAEVKWCVNHYNMTQMDIANRIAELEARIVRPLPVQTDAFGHRLRDREELRHLRECIVPAPAGKVVGTFVEKSKKIL